MTVLDTVNRIYREFKRYTGDGLPGEPTGAPLPVGDPQSGPYSPKKSELRAAFTEILGAAAEAGDEAQEALAELERLYLGAKASDPATDNTGDPLETGALYFNTTDGKFRVWNGVSWQDQSTALGDGEVTTPKLADAAVTNLKLASMAAATIKGRAHGAGSGEPDDLTADEVRKFTAARGHLYGLTTSNNATDATNDIDIATGEAASTGSNPILMVSAAAVGKRLDAVYASGGTPAAATGGRFDAAISDGTWFVFMISNGVDIGFGFSKSLDPTGADNYPAGYDHYRRVGAVLRVSGAIKAFKQRGDWFAWQSWTVPDMNAVSVGTVASLHPLTVPTGIEVEASVVASVNIGSSAVGFLLTSPIYDADILPSASGPSQGHGSSAIRTNDEVSVITDTFGQIRARTSVAATSVTVHTRGFRDLRGRCL